MRLRSSGSRLRDLVPAYMDDPALAAVERVAFCSFKERLSRLQDWLALSGILDYRIETLLA
jgi:hypothetical protein